MMSSETARALMRAMVRFTYFLQAPLFAGLALMLLLFAGLFLWSIGAALADLDTLTRTKAILLVLDLLDMIFIANLIAMVMVSGYNTYYAHGLPDADGDKAFPVGDGFGSMKPKIAVTMVIISAIHLLHDFLESTPPTWPAVAALIAIHLTLLLTAVALVLLARERR
jgi:uncharacterized protein (TIGR00645 family)